MKYLEIFENFDKPTNTNRWKYTLSIKNLFTDEDISSPTEENKQKVIKICNSILFQLKKLEKNTINSNIKEDEKDLLLEELENLIDNFQFGISLASGEIEESKWDDYSFDGNFQKYINNECLEQLYDLGDRRIINKKNEIEKYFFVK
jgi:hypothetical protein